MALLPIHRYFIYNGELKPVIEFIPSENEGGIYEVIRVVDGVPMFLEDHLTRFYASAEIAQKTLRFSKQEVHDQLKVLIKKNRHNFGNVLISYKTNLKSFFIAHKYPSENQYENGVSCGVLHAERQNPNAKVFQTAVRQQANDLLDQNNYYEVILVDSAGLITEGSRSNVFFVKGNSIVTPQANRVLLGITRQKTIKCTEMLGLSVFEEEIKIAGLNKFDAAFITGTSPKILPLSAVGNIKFNAQNEILKQLILEYDHLINEYIKNA